jgi:hypothetical protein
VTRTRAQYQQKLIEIVMRAAHEDARHAEWLLERQFPHEFAPYDRRPIPVEPEPEDKKKINVGDALLLSWPLGNKGTKRKWRHQREIEG